MIAFIATEAEEKAREIRIKADQEGAKEKGRLVQEGTDAISIENEKRYKQASQAQQIQKSQIANRTRLRILAAQEEMLDSLFTDIESKLGDIAKDTTKYKDLLTKLLVEGFVRFPSEEAEIRCRDEDAALVKEAIPAAAKEAKEKTGKDAKATIDEANPLPKDSAGGIIVTGMKSRVEVDNTLESRLEELKVHALPAVRQKLFGKNESRRFTD